VAAAQNRAPRQQQGRQKGGGQGGQVARHSIGQACPHQDPQQLLEVPWQQGVAGTLVLAMGLQARVGMAYCRARISRSFSS
jgi:hypothetical protein